MKRPVFLGLASSFLATLVVGAGFGQEESVNPGINDSFVDPDPRKFVERFEKEGREVYDNREKTIISFRFQASKQHAKS